MKKIILFLIVLLTASVQTISAQSDGIDIEINRAELTFPDSITFHFSATLGATIEKITLIYGTNGQSCQANGARQLIEFEPGDVVETSWLWELDRSGGLPPGSQIWWQWEVELSENQQLLTERQTITITDDTYSWQTATADNVTVYWAEGDQTFANTILNLSNDSLDHLESSLGLPQPEHVDLFIYPSAEAIRKAILNVPEWTGGVAFPKYSVTALGVAPDQLAWATDIVPHELTHLVEGILTFNCRGINLPTWLVEGLARYAEGAADSSAIIQLQNKLEDGRLPTLQSLSSGFSAYSEGASLAYTQSGQVVGYLIETYGAEQMTALLLALQSGQEIDEALTAVYGFDTNGLDVAWRDSRGVAATPTAPADSAQFDATPTAVPTLALGGIPAATIDPSPTTPVIQATPSETREVIVTPPPTNTPFPLTDTPLPVESPTTEPTTPIETSTPNTNQPLPWVLITAVSIFIISIAIYLIRRGS